MCVGQGNCPHWNVVLSTLQVEGRIVIIILHLGLLPVTYRMSRDKHRIGQEAKRKVQIRSPRRIGYKFCHGLRG